MRLLWRGVSRSFPGCVSFLQCLYIKVWPRVDLRRAQPPLHMMALYYCIPCKCLKNNTNIFFKLFQEQNKKKHLLDLVVNTMSGKKSHSAQQVLASNAKSYCENTTIHGFVFWVTAPRLLEKLFWVVVVIVGLVFAGLIIKSAIEDWQENPGVVTIKSFSKVNYYALQLSQILVI
jgi:hypothetical protein